MADEDYALATAQELRDEAVADRQLDEEIAAGVRAMFDISPDEYQIVAEAWRVMAPYLALKYDQSAIHRLTKVITRLHLIARYEWGLGEDEEDE